MPDRRITVWVQRFKDRRNLMLQWIDPDSGVRRSKSARTADPSVAEKAKADLEYELNHGLSHEPNKMPWKRFREIYEDEKLSGNRVTTRKKAGYVFDSFEDLARPKTLGMVTERLISQYVTRLRADGMRPATICGHLAYLKAALGWAAGQKLIHAVPRIEMPKVPKRRNICKITPEEFPHLLDKAPDVLWHAYIATAWYSGMRRNEMLELTWDSNEAPHLDFRSRRIVIPAAYNKSDDDQWVPLHPELAEILQALPREAGHIFPFRGDPRQVSKKFARIARAAGLKITLHDLRRSFGSRYASVVPAPVLQRLMRHADIKTTMEFYTNVDDVLDEAIRKA